MLNFAYPQLLWLLLLIPLFIALYALARHARRRKLKLFGNPAVLAPLMPDVSQYKPLIKFSLAMCALFCLIVAAARPWGGLVDTGSSKVGMEVVLAVDASNSMLASATDNPDDASRMTTAKIMLERLIDNMTNDRVGLVVFAGEAYQLIPASSDYASAKSFLNSISPAEIPVQGTDIESAIEVARATFSKDKNVGKAIVLLTDVEELDDADAALKAVASAREDGIQVDVIGVGASQGVTIPYENGVFRDESGNVVHTALNADFGREIARAGGGVYVNAASGDAISMLQRQLRKSKQSTLSASTISVHDELYMYFAFAALLFLVLEACVAYGKNRWLKKVAFFNRGRSLGSIRKVKKQKALLLLALVAVALSSCVSKEYESSRGERTNIAEGNKAYVEENYTEAGGSYDKALEYNSRSEAAKFNRALAGMRSALALTDSARDKGIQEAMERFEDVASVSADPLLASQAYYNMGNIMLSGRQIPQSIELYKKALRLNPSDSLARRNLRIAQLNQKPDENGGNNNDDKKDDKDKDKNKDNDKKQQDQQQQQQDQQQQQPPQPQPQQQQSQPRQPQQLQQGASDRILQRSQNKENEVRRKLYQQAAEKDIRRRHRIKNW